MCVKSEIECDGDLYQFSAEITQEEVHSEHFGAIAWHTEYVIENIVLSINGEIVEDVPELVYDRLENQALIKFKYGEEA